MFFLFMCYTYFSYFLLYDFLQTFILKKKLLFKSYIYYFTLHYNMIYYNTDDENWLNITATITLCVEVLFFMYLTAEVFFQNYSIRDNKVTLNRNIQRFQIL